MNILQTLRRNRHFNLFNPKDVSGTFSQQALHLISQLQNSKCYGKIDKKIRFLTVFLFRNDLRFRNAIFLKQTLKFGIVQSKILFSKKCNGTLAFKMYFKATIDL